MNEDMILDQPNLPLVVGIDLGGTQIRIAVLRGSNLLSRVSEETGVDPTPERIIPRMHCAIQKALDKSCSTLEQIRGIGIGVAGPLNSESGVVFAAPNLSEWENIPLQDIFQEYYNLPVFVENDANAAALGEYVFGAGRGCKNMVYLTISTGIGSGIIINGQIVEGTSGTAGELGHMTVDWRGECCNCGNIGCLESIASGTAIARRANEAIAAGQGTELLAFAHALQQDAEGLAWQEVSPAPSRDCAYTKAASDAKALCISARTVAQAAQAGIPLAARLIRDAAEALGVGLVNIIHVFNPELIILGGGLTQMGDLLMEPALRIVRVRAMRVPYKDVRIVQAHMDAEAGLVGAGALVYHRLEMNGVLRCAKGMVGAS